ncbi:MAG: DUF3344 domain-containing protein [Methanoculleus sp.]|nr:DUF3344 domain-containing protein [Methanoculleus sp.]
MSVAKPRRSRALTIALVFVGLLSFVGVVAADDYWKGTPPVTELSGVVNGGVDVLFADTWTATGDVTDWSKQKTWGNLTFSLPENATLKFARLYVVPYCGSMTADYYGNMTVKLYNGNTPNTTLVDSQSLNLKYINTSGANYTSVSAPMVNLSRVTSDYVAIFDVRDNLAGWSGSNLNVSLTSYNLTGRFDGRFKETKLVYGWNVTSGSTGDTKYWVNDGHDPITKKIGTYTDNKTVFSGVSLPGTYTANLWVDLVAGNSTSGPGYGKYWWDGSSFEQNISVDSSYSPTVEQGKYAGLNKWTWTNRDNPGLQNGSNTLKYSRTNDYYKIISSVLTIR